MVRATQVQPLIVLDPTAEPIPQAARMAPPVATLTDKRVGLLANGKRNSDLLLEEVLKRLLAGGTAAAVIRRTKDNVSRPAQPAILEELAAECDYVLTAIGD